MTILKRRLLGAFFFLLFLVLAPMIIFYANGNILGDSWNILATGGIYIQSMESGSELYLNDNLKDTTTFFTRDYFVKNLKSGQYTILVKKTGYNEWKNTIDVFENKVSETRVFMLPIEITITEISKLLVTEKTNGTTTEKISKTNPNYETINSLFSTTSIKYLSVLSTTTGKTTKYAPGEKENPIINRHTTLWSERKNVFIGWNGNQDSSPKIFCKESIDNINCKSQLEIYEFKSNIVNLDFSPGESDVVVVAAGANIYAVEASENPDKMPQIIYSGKKPDFRIDSNSIYVKDGDFIGKIEL